MDATVTAGLIGLAGVVVGVAATGSLEAVRDTIRARRERKLEHAALRRRSALVLMQLHGVAQGLVEAQLRRLAQADEQRSRWHEEFNQYGDGLREVWLDAMIAKDDSLFKLVDEASTITKYIASALDTPPRTCSAPD